MFMEEKSKTVSIPTNHGHLSVRLPTELLDIDDIKAEEFRNPRGEIQYTGTGKPMIIKSLNVNHNVEKLLRQLAMKWGYDLSNETRYMEKLSELTNIIYDYGLETKLIDFKTKYKFSSIRNKNLFIPSELSFDDLKPTDLSKVIRFFLELHYIITHKERPTRKEDGIKGNVTKIAIKSNVTNYMGILQLLFTN